MESSVGKRCSVCVQPIVSALVGAFCQDCGLPFHPACLDDPERCARCGRTFLSGEDERCADEEERLARSVRLGRRVAVAIAFLVVAVPVAECALIAWVDRESGVGVDRAMNWLKVPPAVLIAGFFYLGFRGARVVLLVCVGLRLAGSILELAASADAGLGTIAAWSAAEVLLHGAVFYALAAFPPLLLYLTHTARGDPVTGPRES